MSPAQSPTTEGALRQVRVTRSFRVCKPIKQECVKQQIVNQEFIKKQIGNQELIKQGASSEIQEITIDETSNGSRKQATRKPKRKSTTETINRTRLIPVPALSPSETLSIALTHLISIDPRFKSLSQKYLCKPWTEPGLAEIVDPHKSLVLSVISQQVSGAAARSIGNKFVNLFIEQTEGVKVEHDVDMDPEVVAQPGVAACASSAPVNDSVGTSSFFPKPEQIILHDVASLKRAGLSTRKAEYILTLSHAFLPSSPDAFTDTFFRTASDDEIERRLVAIRGIGPWSAEMFMMFCLKRLDVLSTGDLGIQRGMAYWVGKDVKSTRGKGKWKYLGEAEMHAVADPWRPFRSIGCWFMWRVNEHTPVEEKEEEAEAEEEIKEETKNEMIDD